MSTVTVKVSNLSSGATAGDLDEVFFLAGSIVYIEMQRETQVAFISFRDLQGAQNALGFSGKMIVDSPIIVTMAPDYQALASTMTTVKVSHVSVGATEGDLQNVFFLAGSIMYIEMHRETKVAYITFRDLQGAKEAVNFSGATIVDSSVTVTMAPDYQLSPSLVQMGTVTIQLMCKTQRVGLVIGKGRATIKAILADTGANVTTSPLMPGYQVVTIASFENVQGYSSPVASFICV
ncbi:PREDICTED: uncharacterized protein LOC104739763 [Camelina sativa]|uniref:Uncharacterized protein LOC104739763 n=1 Tax=Camelina sativa TaxID=90675 RepID=A0ABM0VMP7_CAMSA|nr:PREDICTED: uncharacterized protein LOC104739763 [Camelina sativa]